MASTIVNIRGGSYLYLWRADEIFHAEVISMRKLIAYSWTSAFPSRLFILRWGYAISRWFLMRLLMMPANGYWHERYDGERGLISNDVSAIWIIGIDIDNISLASFDRKWIDKPRLTENEVRLGCLLILFHTAWWYYFIRGDSYDIEISNKYYKLCAS